MDTLSKLKAALLICALTTVCMAANAQFYVSGTEPSPARWMYIETPSFKLIYPSGTDSLAVEYAKTLERVSRRVGSSAGFSPNASFRTPLPVLLRPYAAVSNGQVVWTPRRMELYTQPDPFWSESTPWEKQLIVHESRHAAQMQFTTARPFRFFNILTGQLAAGAFSALYTDPAFLEGDAVATETALSHGGRGRSADFLEYYRSSFAEGDVRDYWKWRYGSQKNYTPSYYQAGYVAHAGIRTLYDRPDFTAYYFGRIRDNHGFALLGRSVRKVSGKSFNKTFREISDTLASFWRQDDSLRGPFMQAGTLVGNPKRFFEEFSGLEYADDRIFAVRSSLTSPAELVEISPEGKVRKLGNFAPSFTGLRYDKDSGRLFWTEYSKDLRWEQKSSSDLFRRDSNGRRTRLTKGLRLYHPAPSPDGRTVAVTEYPLEGGSLVRLIDPEDGSTIKTIKAPDGMQLVQTAWVGEELYADILSDDGYGIYRLPDFRCVLEPSHVKIKQLRGGEEMLYFTCDFSGVDEICALTADGKFRKLTNTRLGASDFTFGPEGKTLFFTSLKKRGRGIDFLPVDSLLFEQMDFAARQGAYPFADALSRAEQQIDYAAPVETGEPKRYSKAANLLQIHSWIPLYVDYDAVDLASGASVSSIAGLGATLFFQNTLGSFYGTAGYKASSFAGEWWHSGHLSFTYRGLYPVFEGRVDLGEGKASVTSIEQVTDESGRPKNVLRSFSRGAPLLNASLKTYVPLSSSTGGWRYGLVPQLKLQYSNDLLYYHGERSIYLMSTLSARGYIMESTTPSSRIWPRLGVGAELGCYGLPFAQEAFRSNTFYSYLYGYLPGLYKTHGLKLTGLCTFGSSVRLTADYAIPFAAVDWSGLCPVAYLRNFELLPHAELTVMLPKGARLYEVGSDLVARFENFLWIPYPVRIGVTYRYAGSLGNEASFSSSPHSFGLTMSVEM